MIIGQPFEDYAEVFSSDRDLTGVGVGVLVPDLGFGV